jgi:hypothetical protein
METVGVLVQKFSMEHNTADSPKTHISIGYVQRKGNYNEDV